MIIGPIRDFEQSIVGLVEIGISHDAAAAQIAYHRNISMLVGLAILAAVVVMVWLVLRRWIIRPVQEITAAAIHLATAELPNLTQAIHATAQGDLTASLTLNPSYVNIDTQDELGKMAQSFNGINQGLNSVSVSFTEMQQSLKGHILKISEQVEDIRQSSAQLRNNADHSQEVTSEIVQIMQNLAVGAAQQAQSATHTTNSVAQMSQVITGVAQGAQEQAAAMGRSTGATSQLAQAINQPCRQCGAVANRAGSGGSLGPKSAANGQTLAADWGHCGHHRWILPARPTCWPSTRPSRRPGPETRQGLCRSGR